MWPTLFDLFSLLYAVLGVRTLVQLIRQWRAFWDETLTPEEQRLAQSVGFFLIIPIGVLFHEYGHLLATRMVGGNVIEFQWRLFWGYVVPVGNFTPAQDWWIALSGNLISVVFGLLLLALGYWGRRFHHVLRFLLLETGYFQVMYALVGYPVLSLLGFVGDWVVIYNFHRTPVLSSITAVAHVVLLLGVWRWWKREKVQELRFVLCYGSAEEWRILRQAVESAPTSPDSYLRLADYYAQMRAFDLARTTLMRAVRRGIEDGQIHARLGEYALEKGNLQSAKAHFERALSLGLTDEIAGKVWANVGITSVQLGAAREALEAFSHIQGSLNIHPYVLYWRGVARRNVGDVEGALADFQTLTALAPDTELAKLAQAHIEEIQAHH